jgi:hypothetical protein
VKLLRVENNRYFLHLDRSEKAPFELVLRLYPVIPSAHQSLSETSPNLPENQKLLDEALAEQRKENKLLVQKLLADPERFKATAKGVELTLTAGEIEWVLQVLNDVRVGHWLLLGSPEEHPAWDPHAENAPQVMTMALAGHFQMELLEAIKHNAS